MACLKYINKQLNPVDGMPKVTMRHSWLKALNYSLNRFTFSDKIYSQVINWKTK
jgi:hypothetical protein